MSDAILSTLCERIAEHCVKHSIHRFVIEFHGGEPLLVGKKRFVEIAQMIRSGIKNVELDFLLQTNGTLLDVEWVSIFQELGVSVGVSLDGPAPIADKARKYRNGRGSTDRILENLRRIRNDPESRSFRFGVLSVISTNISGSEMVYWAHENEFESIDFLLPLGNYANLPANWKGAAPYTDFLLSAYDAWVELGDKSPQIRLFETMLRGKMGIKPQLDALGGDLNALCVVETNGAIGISDVVRMCGGDLARDSIFISDTTLDQHSSLLNVSEQQIVSSKCTACAHYSSCGGGYLPHRYDGLSFQNPSLYCDSLMALSARMNRHLVETVPPHLVSVSE